MAEQIEVSKLRPHPKNVEIYGNEDVSTLAELIDEFGLKEPLKITHDNTIISGHRRYLAALQLRLNSVPVEIESYDSENEELEALILYNAHRDKTVRQKTREGMALEGIIAEKARKRKLATQNNNAAKEIAVMDDSSTSGATGTTRDEVARQIGLRSGKQYDRMKSVLKEIDRLEGEDKKEDAELLNELLEKSASTAYDFIAKVGVNNLTSNEKDDLINGRISANSFIKQKASGNNISKVDTVIDEPNNLVEFPGTQKNEAIEAVISNESELEPPIINVDYADVEMPMEEIISYPSGVQGEIISKLETISKIIDELENCAYDCEYDEEIKSKLDFSIADSKLRLDTLHSRIFNEKAKHDDVNEAVKQQNECQSEQQHGAAEIDTPTEKVISESAPPAPEHITISKQAIAKNAFGRKRDPKSKEMFNELNSKRGGNTNV